MGWLLIAAPLAGAVWLAVLGVRDLRRKNFAWGLVSLLIAFGLVVMPIPTHSIVVDLPGKAK